MVKLIICAGGTPSAHGYKRREFLWSEPHKLFIHAGKEYTPAEFNAVIEKSLKDRYDLRPFVKTIETADPSDPRLAAANDRIRALEAQLDTPPQDQREYTLAEAEDLMQKLAPHRLKGKTGPKSSV